MSEIKKSHMPRQHINVKASVFVVSDSLSKLGENWLTQDKSGQLAVDSFKDQSFQVTPLRVIPDETDLIVEAIQHVLRSGSNLVLMVGGTGVSPRDVTIEAVRPLLDKELPGFGEVFRLESYREVGTMAIMSRAIAGVIGPALVCCLPGSPNAVKLGISLLNPEVQHILNLLLQKPEG